MRYLVIRASHQYGTGKADGGGLPYEGCIPFMAEGFRHMPIWLANSVPPDSVAYLLEPVDPNPMQADPADWYGYPSFMPEDENWGKVVPPPEGGWPPVRVVIADGCLDCI